MRTAAKPVESAADARGVENAALEELLPLHCVYRWERERPDTVFLTQPVRGQVQNWTWAQALDEARRVAACLRSRRWPPESRIAIVSKNSAWWIMAELAVWMAGHITVPLYASLKASSVRTILQHCEPVACFLGPVEDSDVFSEGIPDSIERITLPNAAHMASTTWQRIIETTQPILDKPLRGSDEIATIIYTSGTTGMPKGAMHAFRSFIWFADAAIRATMEKKGGRMLSYLPLAHIAERALVEAVAYRNGCHLFFVDRVDTFVEDLRRARPTIFFSVPRLYVKFQQKVLAKVPQAKLQRLLKYPVIRQYVQKEILRELGLDCARLAASGGASMPLSTLQWFRDLGLPLVEGYGMTETGITHTPPNCRSKPGYVGDSVPGVETKVSEVGEVLVRSPMNMIGYYKNPEQTRDCFTEDGFFRTGDLGEIDSEGWLKIIGRVKEQFKTSKGKYVSPNPIEKILTSCASVDACCVMGTGMASPFAIVSVAQDLRDSLDDPKGRERIEFDVLDVFERTNKEVEPHERLQFIVVTDQTWSVSNGMLTPTMKLKRNVLEAMYHESYEDWAARNTKVVWHLVSHQMHARRPGI